MVRPGWRARTPRPLAGADGGTVDKTSSITTKLVKPFINVFLYKNIILQVGIGFANAIDLFALSR